MQRSRIKIYIFSLTVLVIIFFALGHGQQTDKAVKPVAVFTSGNKSYYKTATRIDSAKEILNHYLAGEFKQIEQSVLNAGIAREYYWIHFNVANVGNDTGNAIIDIDNARINELELFELCADTLRSLGNLGDFYPFYQRAQVHKNFLYQLSLDPNQKKEFFLFVNQVGHACLVPVKIFNAKHFRSVTFKDYLFDGVTYGILLFVAFLSLLLFVTSKYPLYLYYSLYIFTSILWFLSYFGLGYQYLWPDHPALNTSMAPFMASVNILLNLQICQILLRLSKTNSVLNGLVKYTKYALVLIALFPLAINLNNRSYAMNHNYLICFLCVILLAMIIVSTSVIIYAVRGLLAAKLYLIASILKALSIINLAMLELGIGPVFYNMETLLQIGIFIEITLLTYALAIRYTNFKVKTFVKVIEAHEKERSLISKEIHDSISNTLTGISYGIRNLTRDIDDLPEEKRMELEKIFDELNKVQLEARNISHNTMPDYIKKSSITEIVGKHVEELQGKAKNNSVNGNYIQLNFSANEQIVNFSEAVKLNIFRITQEIFTNILRHSGAFTADMVFSFNKKEMVIIAEDDGIGFYHGANKTKKGMGIKNIRSRVELLDGSITIKSPIYKRDSDSSDEISLVPIHYGTMIKIKIPYRNNSLKNMISHDY